MANRPAGHYAKPRTAIRPSDPGADLWGKPPAEVCRCPACGLLAEPYRGRFCFLCDASGRADRVLANPHLLKREAEHFLAAPEAKR